MVNKKFAGSACAVVAVSTVYFGSFTSSANASVKDIPTISFNASTGEVKSSSNTVKVALLGSSGESSSSFKVTMEPGVYRDANQTIRNFASGFSVTCTGTEDSPHWSVGSKGVIAKARVTCTGSGATLRVAVQQYLGRTAYPKIETLKIVKESNYVQSVTTNTGKPVTWYVPKLGETGAPAKAYFRASHAGGTVPPFVSVTVRGTASKFLWVNPK